MPSDADFVDSGRRVAEELLHARTYDPVKAHEYYMRTRKLKGRKKGLSKDSSGGRPRQSSTNDQADLRASRRKELEAQKKALEKRLEKLKYSLRLLVEQAKKRSGVEVDSDKEKKQKDTTESTASKKSKSKNDKPLTELQKREKREAAREQYEKEKGTSLSKEVEQLREQVKDAREKLEAAVAEARRKSAKPKTQTATKGR